MHYLFLNGSLTDSVCVREELAQLSTAEPLTVLQDSNTHMEWKVGWKTEPNFGLEKGLCT